MAQEVSMLPPGLALKKIKRAARHVPIIRRRLDGPEFKVEIDYVGYREFRGAATESAALRNRSANPDDAEAAAFAPMLDLVARGWSGATLHNLNYVLRGDRAIRPENEDEAAMAEFVRRYVEGQEEIPFTPAFFSYVWFNSYPNRLQDLIFAELQNWEDEITGAVKKGKDA